MSKEFFLVDAFDVDGWFYIITKSAVLVTDHSELFVGAEIQFIYPEHAEKPKVRKGKIVMESESESLLKKEMDRRCELSKKQQQKISGNEVMEKHKKNEEAEQKRLAMQERKRQANVEMAKELEEDLAVKKKKMDLTLEEKLENVLKIADQLWEAVYELKKEMQSNKTSSKLLPSTSQFTPFLPMENIETPNKNNPAVSNTLTHKSSVEDDSTLSSILLACDELSGNIETLSQEQVSTLEPVASSSTFFSEAENAQDYYSEDKSPEKNTKLVPKMDKIDEKELWMLKSTASQYDNKMVIELGNGSGVFIRKAEFKMDISKAGSENVLARSILLNLFTEKALAESTIDGKGISEEEKKRLRLPEVAIQALLKYVHAHARKMNWRVTSDAEVKRSLRDKIKELRNKNKKKNC